MAYGPGAALELWLRAAAVGLLFPISVVSELHRNQTLQGLSIRHRHDFAFLDALRGGEVFDSGVGSAP